MTDRSVLQNNSTIMYFSVRNLLVYLSFGDKLRISIIPSTYKHWHWYVLLQGLKDVSAAKSANRLRLPFLPPPFSLSVPRLFNLSLKKPPSPSLIVPPHKNPHLKREWDERGAETATSETAVTGEPFQAKFLSRKPARYEPACSGRCIFGLFPSTSLPSKLRRFRA